MEYQPLFPIIDGKYRMDREPDVRIGVVLAADKKATLEFTVPTAGYLLHFGEGDLSKELQPGEPYVMEANANWVMLGDTQPMATMVPSHVARLIPPAHAKAGKPGDGVQVKGIVAGRGFHWHKLIDQTLTHVLEFRARDGHLILINELPLETYLTGVITGEMSGECPIEFMKAQAVAARSWLLGQPRPPHPGEPFLWCNDDCCQRYQGTGGWSPRAVQAIAECRGQALITATNHYCDARYSKSTGGFSEDADFIWGEKIEGLVSRMDAPAGSEAARFDPLDESKMEEFLRGKWLEKTDIFSSPNVVPEETITRYLGRVDEGGHYFRWQRLLTQESLREALRTRGGIEDLATVLDLHTGPRGRSGRQAWMDVDYATADGRHKAARIKSDYKIRASLSTDFLFSSCFVMEKEKGPGGALAKVRLYGGGWGHGAGLCQIGGLGRALRGQSFDTILGAYYTGVRLERLYD